MTKKYKILALILGLLVIIILLWLAWSKIFGRYNGQNLRGGNLAAPEFMNAQEKKQFQVPSELKAQIINRNEAGGITVYKIVNTDADVVLDPNKVPALSPRQPRSAAPAK